MELDLEGGDLGEDLWRDVGENEEQLFIHGTYQS